MTYRDCAFVKGIHQSTNAISYSGGSSYQTTSSNISSSQISIQTVGYAIEAVITEQLLTSQEMWCIYWQILAIIVLGKASLPSVS